jgi:small subunit ribosomal protein S27e
MEIDLLHPVSEDQRVSHKKKRLIQGPNSYFIDIKCPGCYSLTTAYSHAQTVITCEGCQMVLATPTGGKCKLQVGCSFRRKTD